MNYCINPDCSEPRNKLNKIRDSCYSCHSRLMFNGYRVTELLKETDSSQVYEIKKGSTTRILKVTPTQERNSRMANNPTREGTILQNFSHKGIPRVEQDEYFAIQPSGSRKKLYCLIMEKFEGQDLENWLSQNSISSISDIQQVINWFTQLTQILSYIHKQGYIHRDIKPANIILRLHGQVGLVDFGSARKLGDTFILDISNAENATVTICVSEGYTSPEQRRGRPSQRSDFFSLARTIVHLLTGTNPINLEDDLGNCKWRSKAPFVPESVALLLDDMMAYKPSDRPASTQVILERLEGDVKQLELLDSNALLHAKKAMYFVKGFRESPLFSLVTVPVFITFLIVSLYQRNKLPIAPLAFISSRPATSGTLVPMCRNSSCIGRDAKDNACAPVNPDDNQNKDVVRTITSVLVNNEQYAGKTFRLELRYSPLCNSTWVRSWAPPGSFHYLQDTSGKQYGRAEVKNDSSFPYQYSDMGPGDISLKACVQQTQGDITCTSYISPPY